LKLLKVENTSAMPNATTTSRTLDFGIDKKKLNATNFKKRQWPHYNEARRIITQKSSTMMSLLFQRLNV